MAKRTESAFTIHNLMGRAPAKPNAQVLAQRAEASTNLIAKNYEHEKADILRKIQVAQKEKLAAAKAKDARAYKAACATITRQEKRLEMRYGISAKLEQACEATSDSLSVLQAVDALRATTAALTAATKTVAPEAVETLLDDLAEAMEDANTAIGAVSAPFSEDPEEFDQNDMDDYLEQVAADQEARAAEESTSAAAAAAAPPARPVSVTVVVDTSDTEHLRVAELLSALPAPSTKLPQMTPAQAARAKALARN